MGPSKWALVYQQEDVSSEMVFDPAVVSGATDRRRAAGPITREREAFWGQTAKTSTLRACTGSVRWTRR